jgi:hypothetical protein
MLPPPSRSNPMTVVLPPLAPQPPSPGSLLASDAVDVKPPPILPSCRTEPPSSYTSMSSSVRAIELTYEAVETGVRRHDSCKSRSRCNHHPWRMRTGHTMLNLSNRWTIIDIAAGRNPSQIRIDGAHLKFIYACLQNTLFTYHTGLQLNRASLGYLLRYLRFSIDRRR